MQSADKTLTTLGTFRKVLTNALAKVVVILAIVTVVDAIVYEVGREARRQRFEPTVAYFERAMNERLRDYRKTDGRTLRCTYERMDFSMMGAIRHGFEVRCQYFRGELG